VYRSNYPYAQMAAQRRRRQAVAILLQKKPVLLKESLDFRSSIVTVTTQAHKKIIELYKEPNQLLQIDRRQFEEIIAEIFDGFGYSVELTAQTHDGGRDIIAIGSKDQVRTKYLIECKRPDPGKVVGVGFVRQLLGVVEDEKATKGLLVATTYFSAAAQHFEKRNEWRLELKDYDRVVAWIEQYIRLITPAE